MDFYVFNVSHGSCALLIADNGSVMLFDAGSHETTFQPSTYLVQSGIRRINQLVVSHFDSDHLSDLANILARIPIEILTRNPSVTPEQVRRAKLQEGPITAGMEAVLRMMATFTPPGTPLVNPPTFGNVEIQTFYNKWPAFPVEDTNNLSVVTFLFSGDLGIVLPGDLERAGWTMLLQDEAFRQALRRTNLFIASHHGRQNGYCPEVFEYCRPQLVIISDTAIQYESQEHAYARHATGMHFSRDGMRYVLTTRCDGHIRVSQTLGHLFSVHIR